MFRDVDLFLRAGDIYFVPVLNELPGVAPALAGRGDDDYSIRDKRVEVSHV